VAGALVNNLKIDPVRDIFKRHINRGLNMSFTIHFENNLFHDTFFKALGFHKDGNFPEAKRLYHEVLKIEPRDADTLNNLACVEDDLHDTEAAMEYLNKAIRYYPRYAKAYNNRAYLNKNKGNYKIAIKDYTKAIKLGITDSNCYGGRAWCYERLEMFDKALEDYSSVRAFNTRNTAYLSDIGRVYVKKQCFRQAAIIYRKLFKMKFSDHLQCKLVTLVSKNNDDSEEVLKNIINSGLYFSVKGSISKSMILLPYICDSRIILSLDNLHEGETIRRHMRQHENKYELCFDTDYSAILDRCRFHYNEDSDAEYLAMLDYFLAMINQDTVLP